MIFISTRYFILIHHDKEKLKKALAFIQNELENTYKLKLNINKTKIVDSREGFTFLGYHYRVINNKTITSLIKSNRYKIRKKIINTTNQYKNNKKTFEQAFCSIQTYLNNYKYGSKMYVKRLVERYWFDEFRK